MPLTILYAEDHAAVRLAVKETLERAGWRVVVCSDAASGRREIEGGTPFDVLILDNRLSDAPGAATGMELARLARSLPHRRRTPIVMLSASYVEGEARAAGADVFLRKPQDVSLLVGTIKELVRREG
jgi:CheY-like chemotaxis protein